MKFGDKELIFTVNTILSLGLIYLCFHSPIIISLCFSSFFIYKLWNHKEVVIESIADISEVVTEEVNAPEIQVIESSKIDKFFKLFLNNEQYNSLVDNQIFLEKLYTFTLDNYTEVSYKWERDFNIKSWLKNWVTDDVEEDYQACIDIITNKMKFSIEEPMTESSYKVFKKKLKAIGRNFDGSKNREMYENSNYLTLLYYSGIINQSEYFSGIGIEHDSSEDWSYSDSFYEIVETRPENLLDVNIQKVFEKL